MLRAAAILTRLRVRFSRERRGGAPPCEMESAIAADFCSLTLLLKKSNLEVVVRSGEE